MSDSALNPRHAIVGGLALDNVITAQGERFIAKPGGNTLWASLGGALFDDSIGVVARAGTDYPQSVLDELAGRGVDVGGVRRTGEPHRLRIAYQHLADGRRLQPIPAEALAGLSEAERMLFVDSTINAADRAGADPEFSDIPSDWLSSVLGWHIPLVPLAVHRALVASLAANTSARVIADCPNRHEVVDLVEDMLPSLSMLDVFLPSDSDLDIIDPSADAVQIAKRIVAEGDVTVVLKRGSDGVLVLGKDGSERVVPSIAVEAVDPTGAGDAFCGGFLVGLTRTDDPVLAAVYGAVAASFAVETADPLALVGVSADSCNRRFAYLSGQLDRP